MSTELVRRSDAWRPPNDPGSRDMLTSLVRVTADEGEQPAVDVRSTQLVRSGEVVAEGLNMIGAEAGVRHVDHVEVYLTNLIRLGLVKFSSRALDDEMPYQVLEAQPEVLEI